MYQELRQISRYVKLSVHELRPLQYIYIIVYRNNDDAAQAHHALRAKIVQFGAKAYVKWLEKGYKKISNSVHSCCVQLQRDEIVAQQELQDKDLCCFRL